MKLPRFPLVIATGIVALTAGIWTLQAQDKAAKTPAKADPAVKAAQPAAKPDASPKRADGRLGLTDEQKTKLAALRDKHREAMKALRDDTSRTREQKREKLRESFQTAREEAGTIFTPEQKEKLAQARHMMRKRMHHAMRARMHDRMAGWHESRGGHGRHFGPPVRGWHGRHHDRGGPGFRPGHHQGPPRGMGFAPQPGRRGPMQMGPGGPGFGFGQPGGRGPGGFGAGLDLTDDQKAKVEALQKQQREKMAESMKSFQEQFRAILTPEQQQKLDARRGPGPRPGQKP